MSGDGAEVMQGIAEVNDYEVGWQLFGESFGYMLQGLVNEAEGFVVTGVGEENVGGFVHIVADDGGKRLRENVEASACFGR